MGRGEGPLLKKASPPKPAGAARVPYPLEAFRLVGEAARWEYRWMGMGQGAAGFYGERSCSIKAVNRQTGLRALRAESTRRLWGRWRHS